MAGNYEIKLYNFDLHCVKGVRNRSFSGRKIPVFGPEKLQLRTILSSAKDKEKLPE